MKHIRTIEALTAQGLTEPTAQDDLQRVVEQFALRITPHVAAQLTNPAIAKQYIPTTDELIITPDELADPIGDEVHTPVKGITQRYADRLLLKPTPVQFIAVSASAAKLWGKPNRRLPKQNCTPLSPMYKATLKSGKLSSPEVTRWCCQTAD
jgi:hypothetical protein